MSSREDPRTSLSAGLRKRVRIGGDRGRAAAGSEHAAEAAVGPVHRRVERHGVHCAARSEQIYVDLSHQAVGDAQAVQAARLEIDSGRALQRNPADAKPAPLASDADSKRSDRLRRRHRDDWRQRRPCVSVRCSNSPVRGQSFHAGPVFLQRRWRTADRSASGRADGAHGVRHPRRAARAHRPDSARDQVSRRASRRLCSRLHL